ncbi:MAG TPA: hypothetical protein VGB60_00395 [Brevundimonas sp.]|uniref:hypothetical protein n=1 Tax=Brevundimonas sp. TaxID=1871086 RepID=UPI002EDAE8B7
MARFSIGTAIGDGFSLIRRRPLAVFVWGLLMIAPAAGSFALVFPAMGELIAQMPAPGEAEAYAGPPDQLMAQMMQLQAASMLLNIGLMLVMVVVYAAIFRTILRPGDSGAFSLRVGMDELRIGVVGLAIGVGLYAAMLLLVVICAVVGFAVWTAGGRVLFAVVVGLLVIAAMVAACIGLARVSLIPPATLLYRDFAFSQGWRLAQGQTLRLFGLLVLIFLMILLVETVLLIGGVTAFAASGLASGFDWTQTGPDFNPFAAVSAWVARNWYWSVLGGLVGAFLYGVLMTLAIAPFASACRQLAASASSASDAIQRPAPPLG